MSMAHVEYEVGTVSVEMPYDAELIARLKAELPVGARRWDGSNWVITDSWWDTARRLIQEYYEISD